MNVCMHTNQHRSHFNVKDEHATVKVPCTLTLTTHSPPYDPVYVNATEYDAPNELEFLFGISYHMR